MITELRNLEPQLKEILYECVEHVHATRAALYLSSSHDLNEKTFELVTSYQYNTADRARLTAKDDLVDRIAVRRTAFFVNGVGSDARFSEMLFSQGNDRLLVTPIYSRGRLVGFIDMRDKAKKKPFEQKDLVAAQRIADSVATLLASRKLWGLGPISLVEVSGAHAVQPTLAPAAHKRPPKPPFSEKAVGAIKAARSFMTKRQHDAAAPGRVALNDSDIDVLRLLLPGTLAIRGAVFSTFTLLGQPNLSHIVAALGPLAPDALQTLHNHLQACFRSKEMAQTSLPEPEFYFPFAQRPTPIATKGLTAIITEAVCPKTIDGLVVTVGFESLTPAEAREAVHRFLERSTGAVEAAMSTSTSRVDRARAPAQMLEPDFARYPELVEHCREVAVLSARLARAMNLSETQTETVRLAAMLHDVGLRILDYDELYHRPHLTADEFRGLMEHTVVGAAMVEPLFGREVAQAVLRHHERVDGKGYPSKLTGNQIPVEALIIQVCDAWVTMTTEKSYRNSESRGEAIARLEEGAGTQFDPRVVKRFLAVLDTIA